MGSGILKVRGGLLSVRGGVMGSDDASHEKRLRFKDLGLHVSVWRRRGPCCFKAMRRLGGFKSLLKLWTVAIHSQNNLEASQDLMQ